MYEPTAASRKFARNARDIYLALRQEGFWDDQATKITTHVALLLMEDTEDWNAQ